MSRTSASQLLGAMTGRTAVTRSPRRCESTTGRMCDLAPLITWISAVNPGASQNCSPCHRVASSWLTIALNSNEIFPPSSCYFLGVKCVDVCSTTECQILRAIFDQWYRHRTSLNEEIVCVAGVLAWGCRVIFGNRLIKTLAHSWLGHYSWCKIWGN